MSVYSTKDITREQAIEMVTACRAKKDNSVASLSTEDLDAELHEYVYSERYGDIVGRLTNYLIAPK